MAAIRSVRAFVVLIALATFHSIVDAAPRTLTFIVDGSAAPDGDGTSARPFATLADAVAAGRDAWTAGNLDGVRINVRAGVYEITDSVEINYPLELRGEGDPGFDPAGLPLGVMVPGTDTRLVAGSDASLISVFDTVDVSIVGFTFDPGSRTTTLASSLRVSKVQGFTIQNNVLLGGFVGLELYASSGTIRANYISGSSCGACIDSGNSAHPARVTVLGNRIVENRASGLLLNGGGSKPADGTFTFLSASVRGNDISRQRGNAKTSTGVRIMIVKRDPPDAFAQADGNVEVDLRDNRIEDNETGVMLDAGFPYRTLAGVCDDRSYTGRIDLSLRDNIVSGNAYSQALIAFTRGSTAINTAQRPQYQYLHGATFTVDDRDRSLAGYLFDHPKDDPYLGSCTGDQTRESLGNTLIVNGEIIPNGGNIR
jgi:hypothetical protein